MYSLLQEEIETLQFNVHFEFALENQFNIVHRLESEI
jgi:hypothetical protein